MKQLFSFLFALTGLTAFSQTPQIARVSSTGTTTIYTDLKKAISEAQDDDFIYLPGATFRIDSLIFQKRINIIGTGIYPDSTKATGKTVINTNVYLKGGREGGSLQGVEINPNGSVYGDIIIVGSGNFTIEKCMFQHIYDYDASALGTINIIECVINGYINNRNAGFSSNFRYSTSKSIINDLVYCNYSKFTNCIITNSGQTSNMAGGYYGNLNTCTNDEFYNCIFYVKVNGFITSSQLNNRLFNCHVGNYAVSGAIFTGAVIEFNTTYDANVDNTFVGGICPTVFNYAFDYHVKSTSSAAGNGTDGTDKGIYGTLYPYNPSPYNPHIYYKQVAPSTNAQGQLQINVKAKAQ